MRANSRQAEKGLAPRSSLRLLGYPEIRLGRAHVYFGIEPMVAALEQGADFVITGRAFKFLTPNALPGGAHTGLRWQKAAIWLLLDLEIQ